jgi:hypothetical protein
MYFMQQICSIGVQHCLIMIIVEFFLQVRSLVNNQMMVESISSEKSLADYDAVARKQKSRGCWIACGLVFLLFLDVTLFFIGVTVSLTATAPTYFRIQLTLMSFFLFNAVVYLGVTVTLKHFLHKHFSNKFQYALGSIMNICYLLLVQNSIALLNQVAIYYIKYG